MWQHMKYGVDFGAVPFPVPQAGTQPVVPLGGEEWTIPVSSDTAAVKATWDLVKWLEQPAQLLQFDEGFNYIPAILASIAIIGMTRWRWPRWPLFRPLSCSCCSNAISRRA